jgi:hypothetical protein
MGIGSSGESILAVYFINRGTFAGQFGKSAEIFGFISLTHFEL